MQEYFTNILNQIVEAIPNFLSAVLIFIVSLYLASLIGKLIRRAFEKRNTSPGVANLVAQAARWLIIGFGVIASLQRFFDVTAFLTGLGIIGFTIGFALQDIMKNFVAGMILLIQRPFHVGDSITTTNYTGTILAIDMRATEMKTLDGRIVILPNATILSNPIENYTRANRRRVDLTFSVAYKSTPEQVRTLVCDAVQSVKGFINEPEPVVIFNTIKADSIELTTYFWIDTKLTNLSAAKDSALTKVKAVFEEAKVEIF